jgi:protein ImuA
MASHGAAHPCDPAREPVLGALRREIAAIEGTRVALEERRVLPFGIAAIDAVLSGGLAGGAVHEVGAATGHRGTAFGFALALAARAHQARRADDVLWVETSFAAGESGRLYGIGLENFGLPLARLLIVRVPHPRDVLWVTEEALGCRGIATVIAVVARDPDLTATRRLSLAVRDSGGLGVLIRERSTPYASAALTRWRVAAAPSRPDAFGGIGRTAFDLTLTKNRHGPGGRWTILWDHHERAFLDPLSVGVARTAGDRPDRALERAAGAFRSGAERSGAERHALRRAGSALRRAG